MTRYKTVFTTPSFGVSWTFYDVATGIGCGVVGWFFKRHGFPVAPVVPGIVLGTMAGENFTRAVMMDGHGVFYRDKPAFIVVLIAQLSFVWPLYKTGRQHRQKDIIPDKNG